MKNSKNPKNKSNKPIIDNSLVEDMDHNTNWNINNISESSENSEYIKVITASLELNQIEFPRLFELNEDSISDILKKIVTIGYNSYFPIQDNSNIISDNSNNISSKFELLDTLINKLSGISNNSKKIGIFGENYIQELKQDQQTDRGSL
jgi:hypothetical protein